MPLSRDVAARLGNEAEEINRAREYRSPSGRTVSIASDLERSLARTKFIPPGEEIERPHRRAGTTQVQVRAESTLQAARSLARGGKAPVILNFASGTVPGGGYRTGSRAQEESIAWSSALVPSLERSQEFYALHRELADDHHSDAMIYSPEVVVYRNGEELLEEPWSVAVISAAAPRVPRTDEAAVEAFRCRIPRVLHLGLREGHDAIVLGAWGCGAYGNDPKIVAPIFREAIEEIQGAYDTIVFAISGSNESSPNLAAFQETFNG